MGKVLDFATRRVAGYIVFWILVLFVVVFFVGDDAPAQAGWLFIFGFAFVGSLLYTRRMKHRQLARRQAKEAAQAAAVVAQTARLAPMSSMAPATQAMQAVPPPKPR